MTVNLRHPGPSLARFEHDRPGPQRQPHQERQRRGTVRVAGNNEVLHAKTLTTPQTHEPLTGLGDKGPSGDGASGNQRKVLSPAPSVAAASRSAARNSSPQANTGPRLPAARSSTICCSPACHSSVQYHHWSLSPLRARTKKNAVVGHLDIQLVALARRAWRVRFLGIVTRPSDLSVTTPRTYPLSRCRGQEHCQPPPRVRRRQGNTRNTRACPRATPIGLRVHAPRYPRGVLLTLGGVGGGLDCSSAVPIVRGC